MAFYKVKRPWTKQPPIGALADSANPINRDLISVFNGGQIQNLKGPGIAIPVVQNVTPTAGKSGRASLWTAAANESAILCDGGNFGADGFTAFIIRQVSDTTDRQSGLFGVNNIAGAETQYRMGAHSPWEDGNIYWDYGEDVTKRVSWTGYSKSVTVEDRFCFHAGLRGNAIWHNGEEKALQTTSITRSTRTSDNFYLNDGNSATNFSGDAQKIYFAAFWDRQFSDIEILSLYSNPWQIFQPRTVSIHIPVAAAAGAIMNQMQSSNIGADLYNGTLQ